MGIDPVTVSRVLVTIASYGHGNDRYLAHLIREYRSMSFKVDIVVLSNLRKDVGAGVELVVGLPNRNPRSLPFVHKRIFADRLNDYDLFIYTEDDTLITERNIRAFLRVSNALPADEIPGFIRFEQGPDGSKYYPDVHGQFHWDPESVRSRGSYTLAFFTNEHAACYVLRREQLRRAIASGGFLVRPHKGKYDLLCTAATDPYTQCGAQKVMCISHLDDFLVHHLPNTYVGSSFGIMDCELRRQIQALTHTGQNGHCLASLFNTETKISRGWYSKNYYEPVRPEVVSLIPSDVRSVLSVGCGWGLTEGYLAQKGLRVSAVPLDSVIPGKAEAKGVEIIRGGLAEARQEMANRKFDCLLLSNVLHLIPNPIEVLSNFASLLPSCGVAITVVPNTTLSAIAWKAIRNSGTFEDLGSYERTGVHRVSSSVLRGWFCASGMSVEKVISVLRPAAQKIGRFVFGMLDRWIADEFVAVARKLPGPSAM